jgi:hypothetical protein
MGIGWITSQLKPWLSRWSYKQSYNCLEKKDGEYFLDVKDGSVKLLSYIARWQSGRILYCLIHENVGSIKSWKKDNQP